MSEGIKHDGGKPRLELLPMDSLIKVAQVASFGAVKYGDWNWNQGMKWSRLLGATLRHLGKWSLGQNTDEETGISHLAHATCNLLFLLRYEDSHKGLDDRCPRPAPARETSQVTDEDLPTFKEYETAKSDRRNDWIAP